jgi:hypothetical protein
MYNNTATWIQKWLEIFAGTSKKPWILYYYTYTAIVFFKAGAIGVVICQFPSFKGCFALVSITTPVVSALKNYYIYQ